MLAIKPYNTIVLHRYRLKVKLEANEITQFHKYMSSYGERPGPAGRHEH